MKKKRPLHRFIADAFGDWLTLRRLRRQRRLGDDAEIHVVPPTPGALLRYYRVVCISRGFDADRIPPGCSFRMGDIAAGDDSELVLTRGDDRDRQVH